MRGFLLPVPLAALEKSLGLQVLFEFSVAFRGIVWTIGQVNDVTCRTATANHEPSATIANDETTGTCWFISNVGFFHESPPKNVRWDCRVFALNVK